MPLRRWFWYHRFVFIDTFRRLRVLMLHVIIVAGVCLPILILRGINRGHVADMRVALETNPAGRSVRIFPAQSGALLSIDQLNHLEREIPNTELIIPTGKLIMFATNTKGEESSLTFHRTKPGDPRLAKKNVDVLQTGERALVLSSEAAFFFGKQVDDEMILSLGGPRKGEEDKIAFTVKAVLPKRLADDSEIRNDLNPEGNTGFIDNTAFDLIKSYRNGHAVEDWDLPAAKKRRAVDKYNSYLIFCKKTDDLPGKGLERLRETWEVEPVDDPAVQTLYGLLRKESLEKLSVYRLHNNVSLTDPQRRITGQGNYIRGRIYCDGVVLNWNEPYLTNIGNDSYRLIACTLENPIWLRTWMSNRDAAFEYDADEFLGRISNSDNARNETTLDIPLNNGQSIAVALESIPKGKPKTANEEDAVDQSVSVPPLSSSVKPDSQKSDEKNQEIDVADSSEEKLPSNEDNDATDGKSADASQLPTENAAPIQANAAVSGDSNSADNTPSADNNPATPSTETKSQPRAAQQSGPKGPINILVPIKLLAHVDAHSHKIIDYDEKSKSFVSRPEEPSYVDAMLFTKKVEDVLEAIKELRARDYKYIANDEQINDINHEKASLDVLVYSVTVIVFVFGIATVTTVLWDSTNRKRKDIGILRIMGVSGPAVLYMVLLRALVIGVFAAVLIFAVAGGACKFLAWQPTPESSVGSTPPAADTQEPDTGETDTGETDTGQPMAEEEQPKMSRMQGILEDVSAVKKKLNLTANAFLDLKEDWMIGLLALICSLIGSIAPGILASRLDPFDAVVHAKDA